MLWYLQICLRATVFCVSKVSTAVSDAYFRTILILRCHSFGKCLFSSHDNFQAKAYYQENTVRSACSVEPYYTSLPFI